MTNCSNKSPDDPFHYHLRRHRLRSFQDKMWVVESKKFMAIFAACVMFLWVLFQVLMIINNPSQVQVIGRARVEPRQQEQRRWNTKIDGLQNQTSPEEEKKDELLGGLLAAGFDENSCLSRYQSILYRNGLVSNASSYLVSKLRSYEALHRKCGPLTESYNKTVEKLKSGKQTGPTDCNYIVWIPMSGLGNRIITLASTFIYALLTNRVMLVDSQADISELFCEPFPEVSWLLPADFPLADQFDSFDGRSPYSYGNMLKNRATGMAEASSFVYLHLTYDYDDQDERFFCDQDQSFLQRIPWLIIRSDNYFTPFLFLMPSFRQELGDLFPEKQAVFHLIGRYLFHPSNQVWSLITRYYQGYLANADEKVGIQIRIFENGDGPYPHVLDQIMDCTLKENLLPEINHKQQYISNSSTKQKRKAILVTSLSSWYTEQIQKIYWEYPTMTGEIVGIYQPSHEEYQQSEDQKHNMKAWAEMYLLSMMDKLVTSGQSTFGYVAQGLGGLTPWILYKPENQIAPDPSCGRAMSMEPCFHSPPSHYCNKKILIDTGALVPHVRHCEDRSWGLKLVNPEI